MDSFRSIEWIDGKVRLLDQRLLPHRMVYREYRNCQDVARAIADMVIRGAPAIGAAAAYAVALAACHSRARDVRELRTEIRTAAGVLMRARPTGANLSHAVKRMLGRAEDSSLGSREEVAQAVLHEAHAMAEEDVSLNRQLAANALPLIPDKAIVLHHCNTGSLATVGYGTALGIIRMAHEKGKQVLVLVDETRPRLQGSRLTAWELQQYGIPFRVIVDGASGHFMRALGVNLCVVGCDRVAANGDIANKIGTYNLAVVAHENRIPFYVAAPTTTIDMTLAHGGQIEIEERDPREVTHIGRTPITPMGVSVGNPAFDITPARYVTAMITECGIVYPPYEQTLMGVMTARSANPI